MAQNKVILQVQDVTMQFGGLRAIDSVSFHVDDWPQRRGQNHDVQRHHRQL